MLSQAWAVAAKVASSRQRIAARNLAVIVGAEKGEMTIPLL
jgi:hypothetical protein